MKDTIRIVLIAILVGMTMPLATPTWSAEENVAAAARQFVERVNDASMSFFASGSDADAREKCRELLSWAFDMPAMGEDVVGKAWASTTEEDRKAFLDAFEDEIIGEYLRRMKDATAMTFVGTRSAGHGELLAASKVVVAGKPDQTWIWRLRPQGDTWRIVDVTVDGKSAISSERKTYAKVLKLNHGDMKALIEYVRSRADL
jgi:phospholipid transport system substrate-binding protein